LKTVLNLVRPRFFVPIHGEDRHLAHHGRLAREVGMAGNNVMVAGDGAVIDVAADRFTRAGDVEAGYVYVDGVGIGDIGPVVLRDRRQLAEDGIFVVVVTVNHQTGQAVGRPDVVTRGFVHPEIGEGLIESAKDQVLQSMAGMRDQQPEQQLLQNNLKELLSKYLYERTKRRPMVIPVVMEV
jgi:ribonuclease J